MPWPSNLPEEAPPPGDDAEAIWRDAVGRGWQRSIDSLLSLAAAFQDHSLALSAMEPVRDLIGELLRAASVRASVRNERMERDYFRLRAEGYSVEEAFAEVAERYGISASSAEIAIRRK